MKGLAKHLFALAAQLFAMGKSTEGVNAQRQANALVVNGYYSPYPHKLPNQRQRRKTARQTNNYKH